MKGSKTSRREHLKQLGLGASSLLISSQGLYAFEQNQDVKSLGIALVGLGNYATQALAPAFAKTQFCHLAGIVSGTPAKAEKWKKEHNIPEKNIYNYENFDQIADNDDIDIVYIVLPNALHAEYSIRAAEAGKHVICEKPMAMNAEECRQMIAAAKKAVVKLSIGYRLHFEKHHQEAMRLGQDAVYGKVRFMEGGLAFRVRNTSLWRLDAMLGGGGAIMDLGVYPLQAARYISGEEPISVSAQGYNTAPEIYKGIYESINFQLEFPSGSLANISTSYGYYLDRFRAASENGWFELAPSFNGTGSSGNTSEGPMVFEKVVQQALQMDDFSQCIQEDKVSRVSGEEGLRDMIIIDKIKEAAESGRKILL
ncbi:MAG: Gfo/Idh/MocA family oxidoreductase [Bacteroidota bacterium]